MSKVMNVKEKQMLLEEVIDYLSEHELFEDVTIYTNGRKYSDSGKKGEIKKTAKGFTYYDHGEWDVRTTVEYSNPDTLTMVSESILYDLLNYDEEGTTEENLNEIFGKYGLYLEQGYPWSLSTYPID